MCEIKVQTYIYGNNIYKHKNNKIKLWCNIIFQIDVKQIKNNDIFILSFFEDIAPKTIHANLCLSTKEFF